VIGASVDYAGQIVVSEFLADRLPPCVGELPAFSSCQEQGDSGAVVLAINQGERQEDVLIFLRRMGIEDLSCAGYDYDWTRLSS